MTTKISQKQKEELLLDLDLELKQNKIIKD